MTIIIGYLDGTKQKEKTVDVSVVTSGSKKKVKEQLKTEASKYVPRSDIIYVIKGEMNNGN